MRKQIISVGDNLQYLKSTRKHFSLIYIDPPFNTGKRQQRTQIKTIADEEGSRAGFGNRRYRAEKVKTTGFKDSYGDYIEFLRERISLVNKRLLTPNGSFFLHVDYREVHYCKLMLDQVFGRDSFMNEIIWAYDYGGRSKTRWSAKHDNILWYVKNPKDYIYNYDEIDRIPYLAPDLVGEEKAKRGKTPTDVWWNTIVATNGKEKVGYATQKPLAIVERIVKVHSNEGDWVLDFFAGSGTLAQAAAQNNRNFVMVDNNPTAIEVMKKRLSEFNPKIIKKG